MTLPYVSAYLVARPDEGAFPIEDPYVVDFYTPVLGPTCVALLRWAAGHLTAGEAVETDLAELAVRLGLQPNLGRHAPLIRTPHRLCLFHVAAWNPDPTPTPTAASSSWTTSHQSPPAKPHAGPPP